ncbi:LOW QUALITY PROTEIN: Hypothetical protein PHPALM_6121 [Phytophthora palmivora]|uniref:Uncharacterized protein n=1 Tax=Phytophthora palmivora TaxID=4796 RepID=A0A2P4YFM4_9STRA|nr:LOW QUALITY PROTEIN: Hypothetical protein PHPALM_6121 [Phytophthora palmivora]
MCLDELSLTHPTTLHLVVPVPFVPALEAASPSDGDCSSKSEAFYDSANKDITPDSQVSSEDEEPLTAESAESGGEGAADVEDIGIYLMDQDLCEQLHSIIQSDECENKCMGG